MRTSRILLIGFVMAALSSTAIAQILPKTFTLAWNASASPGVISNRLYCTTNLTRPFLLMSSVSAAVTTLDTPIIVPSSLYFYVTALGTNEESDPSNILEIPAPASTVLQPLLNTGQTNTPQSSMNLFIEAESGILVAPMTITANTSARSGQAVRSTATEQGSVALNFNVATGTYTVWCRVICVDGGSDSFYVGLDGQPEDTYSASRGLDGLLVFSPNFQWTRLNGTTAGTPRLLALATGAHSLRFRCRELGTVLDTICLTTNAAFVPTP